MKKLNESVWSNIQSRSTGYSSRAEDDIEQLDRDGLLDYINEHYVEIGSSEFSPFPVKSTTPNNVWFQIPIFQLGKYGTVYRIIAKFKDNDISKIGLDAPQGACNEFMDKLKEKFKVSIDDLLRVTITRDDGEVTNKVFMQIFDMIITNTENPKWKKKEE